MPAPRCRRLAAACAALVGFAALAVLGGCAPADVRVVTFNIRYGTADDGPDRWEVRRARAIATLRELNADVVGMQEVLDFQLRELCEAFPEHQAVGVGRDDGRSAGEHAPILFRSSRFELLACGHFWLSPTPETPGSKGWDAALPRMCTWVRLRTRAWPPVEFAVFNTHFDHMGERARVESARLLRSRVEECGLPAIVTGDFNAGPDSAVHAALCGDSRRPLADGHAALRRSEIGAGTFHAFEGKRDGARIDWILATGEFSPRTIEIDRRAFDGRFPSDHFAIVACYRCSTSQ